MNNKLICPFCQQELQETYDGKQFWCSNYKDPTHPINLQGTKELWQELIRTRKALDVAVDALKRTDWCAQDYAIAQEALNKITALGQKDVK